MSESKATYHTLIRFLTMSWNATTIVPSDCSVLVGNGTETSNFCDLSDLTFEPLEAVSFLPQGHADLLSSWIVPWSLLQRRKLRITPHCYLFFSMIYEQSLTLGSLLCFFSLQSDYDKSLEVSRKPEIVLHECSYLWHTLLDLCPWSSSRTQRNVKAFCCWWLQGSLGLLIGSISVGSWPTAAKAPCAWMVSLLSPGCSRNPFCFSSWNSMHLMGSRNKYVFINTLRI